MKRAEIRRQMREEAKAKKIYHLTKEDLDKIVAEASNRLMQERLKDEIDKAFIIMMALPCVALHDKFGFGKKRLQELMDEVLVKYDCMIEDYDKKRRDGYDFNVFIEILKAETGFDPIKILEDRGVISAKI